MRIEIWTDVVCPWCYLGVARFERALSGFAPADEVEVVHRSFELDPTLPPGRSGTVLEMLSAKYGMSIAQAAAAEQRVADLAAAEGLPFSADRDNGSTFDVHRLLHLAADRGRQAEVRTALYQGHFSGQLSIFDADALTAVAVAAGLDADEVGKLLTGDAYAAAVREDEQDATRRGIRGVPFFLVGETLGVSGAQPTPTFVQALRQAWDARPVTG